jgi:hypothetical protein
MAPFRALHRLAPRALAALHDDAVGMPSLFKAGMATLRLATIISR